MSSFSFYDLHPRGKRTQFKRRRRTRSLSDDSESDSSEFCPVHGSQSGAVSTVSAHTSFSGSLAYSNASILTTTRDSSNLKNTSRDPLNDPSNEFLPFRRKVLHSVLALAMSLLIGLCVAGLATFMYNIPIMQRVELKSIEATLLKNVYCQETAINALLGHIREYVNSNRKGVVILFLAGAEGSGKTLTVDTMREINHRWKKIVVTHEQGHLNSMNEEALVATLQQSIFSSTLNFVFIDDIPDLSEGTPFVESRLKPALRSLKESKSLVFVVMTSFEGETNLPDYLKEYEQQTVHFEPMPVTCVQQCIADVFFALDAEMTDRDIYAVLDKIDIEEVDGVKVARDGCKSVPIAVAMYISSRTREEYKQAKYQTSSNEL